MESKDRDGIVDKIKKLFALADNNPNQHEAIAAALKAQRLMAEHDVEDWELHGSDEQPIAAVEAEPTRRRWRWQLADVVGSNFRCKSYQRKRRSKDCSAKDIGRVPNYKFKEKEKVMVFYGYQCDAQAAALTFSYLFKTGDRLARRCADRMRNEHGRADGAYNAFVAGFVEGVRVELEKQSQALMLVMPLAVAESYETMAADWASVDSTLRLEGAFAGAEAREAGEQAGREAVRARRMDEGSCATFLSPGLLDRAKLGIELVLGRELGSDELAVLGECATARAVSGADPVPEGAEALELLCAELRALGTRLAENLASEIETQTRAMRP